eukprot:13704679-Alexandrium_andersonii.AAC.1
MDWRPTWRRRQLPASCSSSALLRNFHEQLSDPLSHSWESVPTPRIRHLRRIKQGFAPVLESEALLPGRAELLLSNAPSGSALLAPGFPLFGPAAVPESEAVLPGRAEQPLSSHTSSGAATPARGTAATSCSRTLHCSGRSWPYSPSASARLASGPSQLGFAAVPESEAMLPGRAEQ